MRCEGVSVGRGEVGSSGHLLEANANSTPIQGGEKKSGGRHLAGITNNQDNSSNCDNRRGSSSFEFEMLTRNVTRSGCGGTNMEETHTQRHPNPQCSGRHNRFNSMKLWVQNCYKGFTFSLVLPSVFSVYLWLWVCRTLWLNKTLYLFIDPTTPS